MKKLLTILFILTAFISNAQRTLFGRNNNYLGASISFQAPDIVTSGLILYLDASDISSYAGSGNIWVDKKGNANGTINGAVNYVANGNASYFNFPGADDAYIISSASQVYKDFTIVFQPDFSSFGFSGGHSLFSKGPNTDVSMRFWTYNFADPANTNGNAASVWGVPNSNSNGITDWAGTNSLYLNGVNQTSTFFPLISGWNILGGQNNTTSNWGSFTYCLGAGYSNRAFQGKIAFVLMYNKTLTSAEQLQNFNALKTRFGL
jgi:hypothetical protein